MILNTFCPSFQFIGSWRRRKQSLSNMTSGERIETKPCSFYKYFKRSEIYFVVDNNRRVLGGLYFPWPFTKVWNFWNLNWILNLRFDIHSLSPKKLDDVIITNTHNCIQIFFMRTVILILCGFYTQIKLWLTLLLI